MQSVNIRNTVRPLKSPITARYCASFFCQLRGLTFRKSLPATEGLLLVQSRDSRLDASIHMMFVWMDLAVVWINSAGEVVDVKLARSWRPAYVPQRPARYILELNPERLDDFSIGDRVEIEIDPV
jgi:uncharacterized membrane protein (UPF0127 family)